jgi:hypothetical protein
MVVAVGYPFGVGADAGDRRVPHSHRVREFERFKRRFHKFRNFFDAVAAVEFEKHTAGVFTAMWRARRISRRLGWGTDVRTPFGSMDRSGE